MRQKELIGFAHCWMRVAWFGLWVQVKKLIVEPYLYSLEARGDTERIVEEAESPGRTLALDARVGL